LFVSQPNIPQTSTSATHTHEQHKATHQINNLTTCLVLLLLICLFASSSCLFGMRLYVVCVCACLM